LHVFAAVEVRLPVRERIFAIDLLVEPEVGPGPVERESVHSFPPSAVFYHRGGRALRADSGPRLAARPPTAPLMALVLSAGRQGRTSSEAGWTDTWARDGRGWGRLGQYRSSPRTTSSPPSRGAASFGEAGDPGKRGEHTGEN